MHGCIASSTRRTFSVVDQRSRRCTEVITSTREIVPSEAFYIVVLRRMPMPYWLCHLSGQNGVRST